MLIYSLKRIDNKFRGFYRRKHYYHIYLVMSGNFCKGLKYCF